MSYSLLSIFDNGIYFCIESIKHCMSTKVIKAYDCVLLMHLCNVIIGMLPVDEFNPLVVVITLFCNALYCIIFLNYIVILKNQMFYISHYFCMDWSVGKPLKVELFTFLLGLYFHCAVKFAFML